MSSESLARENRHQADKCAELERRIDLLELNCTKAENARDSARRSMAEFVSRTSMALGYESLNTDSPAAMDVVLSKASEMHQVNIIIIIIITCFDSYRHTLDRSDENLYYNTNCSCI